MMMGFCVYLCFFLTEVLLCSLKLISHTNYGVTHAKYILFDYWCSSGDNQQTASKQQCNLNKNLWWLIPSITQIVMQKIATTDTQPIHHSAFISLSIPPTLIYHDLTSLHNSVLFEREIGNQPGSTCAQYWK